MFGFSELIIVYLWINMDKTILDGRKTQSPGKIA